MCEILSQTPPRLNPGRGHTYLFGSCLYLPLFCLLLSFVYLSLSIDSKFLSNVAIPLTACFDCCATLKNRNYEPQEAVIARIEIISCIVKSVNFALKMIRLLIIRAPCLVVDTLD